MALEAFPEVLAAFSHDNPGALGPNWKGMI
jgi:hypothetical protein